MGMKAEAWSLLSEAPQQPRPRTKVSGGLSGPGPGPGVWEDGNPGHPAGYLLSTESPNSPCLCLIQPWEMHPTNERSKQGIQPLIQ